MPQLFPAELVHLIAGQLVAERRDYSGQVIVDAAETAVSARHLNDDALAPEQQVEALIAEAGTLRSRGEGQPAQGILYAEGAFMESAQAERTKVDIPFAVFGLDQPDMLLAQRLADLDTACASGSPRCG